jgi:hypothetical protein
MGKSPKQTTTSGMRKKTRLNGDERVEFVLDELVVLS